MFDFLERGLLMDEFGGGDGGGGTAVLDAPAEVADDGAADSGAEGGDAPEVADDPNAPPVDPNAAPAKAEPVISEDGKRLSEQARSMLDELRKTNPELAKQFRNALFEADRFKRAVPGGLHEVQELRETVEQLGGDEGIQRVQEELSGWQQFDQQFTAADPRAIDFMVETPEGKQSFLQLAPVAFAKFAELNPEGYSAYVAKSFVSTMDAHRIPLALERLQDFIGDNPKAQQVFKQVADFVNMIGEYAAKPVTAPKAAPAADANNGELTKIQQERDGLMRTEWRRETATEQNRVYSSELARELNGRKISDVQREDILHRVQTKLSLRIKEQAGKLDQYFAVRDKEGFLKFCNAFSRKEIPALLREAVARYVPAKPGPKQTPPANGRTAPAAKVTAGVATVNKMPTAAEIDWSSSFTNIKGGKAALKNGQKVTWKR